MSKARDLANAGTALTSVSATELGYLDGVTSAVQTQLNAKQAVVSGVNDTEIGYLDGVTSAIQTQLNAKEPTLPSQTGNSGKYLTTDGTNKSWGSISASPASVNSFEATGGSYTANTYGDISGTPQSVTLTTGTKALVIVSAFMQQNSSSGGYGYVSFAVSGASSISASDNKALVNRMVYSSDDGMRASYACYVSDLTAGSNTFTLKYRAPNGYVYYEDREITVINLGS